MFLDPPYKTNFAVEAVKIMMENEIVDEKSLIIIETDKKEDIIKQLEKVNCEIEDVRKYGRAYIIFLKRI